METDGDSCCSDASISSGCSGGGHATARASDTRHGNTTNHGSRKHNQRSKKHVNSNKVNLLAHEIRRLEDELRRNDIAISYPAQSHESRPMIGHTKGNTASNRKVIKRHQQVELTKVVEHLQGLLCNEKPK
jgi:hypothetical protein